MTAGYPDEGRIFMTGGTGFFGRSLLRARHAAVGQGETLPPITLLSRNPEAFARAFPDLADQAGVEFVEGDILDSVSLLAGSGFTHVIHAATDSTNGPKLSPLARYEQIVQGTLNIAKFALENGVSRFLHVSSGAVYGAMNLNQGAVSEAVLPCLDPLNRNNAYALGKHGSEHIVSQFNDVEGMQVVIARCFAFAGRDLPLDVHFAIGNFVRDALMADALNIKGDGSAVRSYMSQDDLVRWLLALLLRGRAGEVYNVGSDMPVSIRELADLTRNLLAPGKKVVIGQAEPSNNPKDIYLPNVDKAKGQLDLELRDELPDVILEMADRIRDAK